MSIIIFLIGVSDKKNGQVIREKYNILWKDDLVNITDDVLYMCLGVRGDKIKLNPFNPFKFGRVIDSPIHEFNPFQSNPLRV